VARLKKSSPFAFEDMHHAGAKGSGRCKRQVHCKGEGHNAKTSMLLVV
jgi:hypothetical protein